MKTYRLKFADDGHGVDKIVEFEAEDGSAALLVLNREAKGRWAELWHEDLRICRVRREGPGDGFWAIAE